MSSYNWLPYAAMAGSSLIGNLGQRTNQEFSSTPGDAYMQGLLRPMAGLGAARGISGQPLYPTAGYNAPHAPFGGPEDFAGGYENVFNRMIEPFGEGLGSARAGWSGAGQNVLGSAMGQVAPQIMNQYTQNQLAYDQMQNTAGMYNVNALNQSLAAPWNMLSMYPGSTGNQIVQEQTDPWASALSTGLGMYGINQMFGGSPFSGAPAGSLTGANTYSSGIGQGLGSYSAGPGAGAFSDAISGLGAGGGLGGGGIGGGMAGGSFAAPSASVGSVGGPMAGNLAATGGGGVAGGGAGGLGAFGSVAFPAAVAALVAGGGISTIGNVLKGPQGSGAGNYVQSLRSGQDSSQYGEIGKLNQMVGQVQSGQMGEGDAVRMIQGWMAQDKYGLWKAGEGGEMNQRQHRNQIPIAEAQKLYDSYVRRNQPAAPAIGAPPNPLAGSPLIPMPYG